MRGIYLHFFGGSDSEKAWGVVILICIIGVAIGLFADWRAARNEAKRQKAFQRQAEGMKETITNQPRLTSSNDPKN